MIKDIGGDERAQLVAYANPFGMSDGFVLPLFRTREGSNSLSVQTISPDDRIAGFSDFEAGSAKVRPIDKTHWVRSGEFALWGFLQEGRVLSVGTRQELSLILASIKEKYQRDHFLFLHIADFCRSDELGEARRSAYDYLESTFSTTTAKFWRKSAVLAPLVRRVVEATINRRKPKESRYEYRTDGIVDIMLQIGNNHLQLDFPKALEEFLDAEHGDWKDSLANEVMPVAGDFGVEVLLFSSYDPQSKRKSRITDIQLVRSASELKKAAVETFGDITRRHFVQKTKSFFSDDTSSARVVCTVSSRYNNKGKRKYWFGYHTEWIDYLEDAEIGHFLLVCKDRDIAFALPKALMTSLLPKLRFTDPGNGRYWHIDIVDTSQEADCLDIPGELHPMPLRQYRLRF